MGYAGPLMSFADPQNRPFDLGGLADRRRAAVRGGSHGQPMGLGRIKPVFISYARGAAEKTARAIHRALGGAMGLAFLDSTSIAAGESIPAEVFDSLLGARVIVVIANERYSTRTYCVEELATALHAYRVLSSSQADGAASRDALMPLVIVMPATSRAPADFTQLPGPLSAEKWLHEGQTKAIAQLVRKRLDRVTHSFGERLQALGELDQVRDRLRELMAVPSPRSLHGAHLYPTFGLPTSIGDSFVGRAREMWDLHTALSTRTVGLRPAALTSSLEGGGGFGKSRLAVEYLHRYGPDSYPGGLFWVNADTATDAELEDQLHGVLATLKPATPDRRQFRQDGRNVASELAHAMREIPHDSPALFVVDNIPERGSDLPPYPLEHWCPGVGSVALVVTSRTRHALVPGVHALEIRELAPESAVALLTRGADRGALSETGWHRIAAWVGHWPLALELLNAALRPPAIVGAAELDDMAQASSPTAVLDRQIDALRGSVPTGTLRGVTEALEISYERLDQTTKRAARLLALLSPAPIPRALINALTQQVVPPSTWAALSSRSFVTGVVGDRIEMYGRMHSVLADYLRTKPDNVGEELAIVAKALVGVFSPTACRQPSRWPLMEACRPHAEYLVAALRQLPGDVDWHAAPALSLSLGALAKAQGNLAAAERYQRNAADWAGEHAEADQVTLHARTSLALTLSDLGRHREAIGLAEQTLKTTRRLLGTNHTDTLMSMSNLSRIRGRDPGAPVQEGVISQQKLIVETLTAAWGANDPRTLTAKSRLMVLLAEAAQLDQALPLGQEVLKARQAVLGQQHPSTILSMCNLASACWSAGAREESRSLVRQALTAVRTGDGYTEPTVLEGLRDITWLLVTEGEGDLVVELLQPLVDSPPGSSGLDTGHALTLRVSGTLFATRHFAEAARLQELYVEACRRIPHRRLDEITRALGNHVTMLVQTGAREQAVSAQEELIKELASALPPDDPTVFAAQRRLTELQTLPTDNTSVTSSHPLNKS